MKKILLGFLFFYVVSLQCDFNDVPVHDKNVDQVQVEEVIKVLDMILAELPVFIEKYELNSNLSWAEWKKKYLFLAPAGAIILSIKVYFVLTSIFKSKVSDISSSGANNWG